MRGMIAPGHTPADYIEVSRAENEAREEAARRRAAYEQRVADIIAQSYTHDRELAIINNYLEAITAPATMDAEGPDPDRQQAAVDEYSAYAAARAAAKARARAEVTGEG